MADLLEKHEQQKQAIAAALETLAQLAGDVGMKSLRGDLVDTRLPKLRDERFNLVVLGEFNHGKSTFVNALLGADVLPTGITPTTAAINHVIWAARPTARAVLADGTEVKIAAGKLAEWVTVDGGRAESTRFVEVGHPAAILQNKVTLVDTPGVNDLNEQRAEVTYGYVPRADAVIFLLDAGQALKESERAFLASRVLERSRDRMIFVVGKVDLLTESELADVLAYVREHLARLVDDPPIFAVSARKALAGDSVAGRMGALTEHLARFLSEDRGRILLDNAAGDALSTASYLAQNLSLKQHALSLTIAELEGRVGRAREQLAATQEQLGQLHGKITAEASAVKAQIRMDLERFTSRFLEALPEQIDLADAQDVKRFLPLFVQDKFKEWAEHEGEHVGKLLEHLAEEIIALASENAAQATSALADRLGPGDTRIEMDVDSFKYDLSVYAVGALGTGVMVFVNTLVGGLLTLAAPILAIVLQSKVSAEIKDQAKERAPEAVRRASAAIGPHFERLVDEFCTRLEDFVTSAGDKLYRGISEVLDQALTERRAQGAELGPQKAQAEAQLAKLAETKEELTKLRAQLWQ
jgi:small GTP-binding protein